MSGTITAKSEQSTSASELRRGKPRANSDLRIVEGITIDPSRDANLTEFGKKTLEDRYLLPGESFQGMFARVSTAYADDADHAQRIYDYISKLWLWILSEI